MDKPHVLVSNELEDKHFTKQLIDDLQEKGIDAFNDPDFSFTDNQPKPKSADWLLLVRTPESMRSKKIRLQIENALDRVAQQRMRGILAITCKSSDPQKVEFPWSIIQTYDGQGENYQTTLEKASRVLNYSGIPGERREEQKLPRILVTASVLLLVVLISVGGLIDYRMHSTPTPNITATIVARQMTATAITISAWQKRYNTAIQGNPALDNPLTKNSNNSKWDENDTCKFQNGKYHISTITPGQYTPCMANHINFKFKNFAYQVQMEIINGNAGGLIFGSDSKVSTFYRFSLDTAGDLSIHVCNGNDQTKCTSDHKATEGTNLTPDTWTMLDHMGETNTLTVIVQNTTIYLYVNKMFIGQVDNAAINPGEIGLYAAAVNQPTEVAFSNVQIWLH